MNTLRENTSNKRPSKERPAYAFQIRELRKRVGLSQRSLATRFNLKRGAVAQWEGGVREPMQRNYKALAELAAGQGLLWLAEFFMRQGLIKRKERSLKAERKRQGEYAESYLAEEKKLAAMGDQEAKRLIGLSEMGRAAYRVHLLSGINREISGLKTGHFSELLEKFADEARQIENLRLGRELLHGLGARRDVSR